jgi:nitrogen fixation protein NifU and related proteins
MFKKNLSIIFKIFNIHSKSDKKHNCHYGQINVSTLKKNGFTWQGQDRMEDNKTQFFQDHSDHYLEMALRTDKRGIVSKPDGYGKRTGQCGDTITFFLTIQNDLIQSIFFDADGCMNTLACANTVIHMAEGKKVEEAWEITAEDIIHYLETLPSEENHCAELAIGAFYLALTNYQELKRTPWKKLYH